MEKRHGLCTRCGEVVSFRKPFWPCGNPGLARFSGPIGNSVLCVAGGAFLYSSKSQGQGIDNQESFAILFPGAPDETPCNASELTSCTPSKGVSDKAVSSGVAREPFLVTPPAVMDTALFFSHKMHDAYIPGGMRGISLHLLCAQIMVRLGQALAGGARPRRI